MKKVFDQTVRDLKREVNKKVLKVPGIEQKILDATSNEPWGPHGSHLADIAQATQNYREYQMIMTVIWKRINDTGKNWRHVYKGLTVLEYLVAHGSERVIDEIREHAYQLSTLSDFKYIDSSGRDQGSNVRRKSQTLVSLVNDKERIQEVRQKALANKEKFRSNRPGGYGDRYDDDRYGSRDDERYGYGRERDWGNRDQDRYGRNGDPYSHDGYKHGRDPDDHYARDSYRDDDYKGHGNYDNQFGSRNRRSVDRDADRSYEDEEHYSSCGGRVDDISQDERRFEHKLSEPAGAPPSYEEATKDPQSHVQDTRDEVSVAASTQKVCSPVAPKTSSRSGNTSQDADYAQSSMPLHSPANDVNSFDEFDPRGPAPAAPSAAHSPDMNFFGSLSALDSTNSVALIPVASGTTTSEHVPINSNYGINGVASGMGSSALSQPSEDPFGNIPFKVTPENFSLQPESTLPTSSFQQSGTTAGSDPFPSAAQKSEQVSNFDFGDTSVDITSSLPNSQHSIGAVSQPQQLPGLQATNDILDGLLPPTRPSSFISSVSAQSAGNPTYMPPAQMNILPQAECSASLDPQAVAFHSQVSQPPPPTNIRTATPGPLPQTSAMALSYSPTPINAHTALLGSSPQSMAVAAPYVSSPPTNLHMTPQCPLTQSSGMAAPYASNPLTNMQTSPSGAALQVASNPAEFPLQKQPSKDKFETKSTVWADTLSRGLVDLNISGPKTNPLADIGIDFDSINRMEKRKEAKNSAVPVTSTVTMGKAMGTGSGIGCAGTSGMAPPPNPMMGGGMGMRMAMGGGMGMGMGVGGSMGMAGYGGGINQQPMGMGMGMNMGMGFGVPMRSPMGMPSPGPGMPGAGYNPMMRMGNYGPQQPYGGTGYR